MDEFWKSVLEKIAATAREAIEADEAGRFGEACVKYEKAARETDSLLNNPNKNAIAALTRASLARSAESYVKRIKQIRNKPKPEPETESKSDLTADSLFVEKPNVKWDDVLGCDEAKRTLKSVIGYLRQPQAREEAMRGCILYGPPGTGKTMLAKAFATEVNASFAVVDSSDMIDKWQGSSERNMKDLFRIARHRAPSIIFFDEADALLSARGDGIENKAVDRMKTIFMTEMDGFKKSDKFVYVVAATNFPWSLDLACARRLEKKVYVPLPNLDERVIMLMKMTRIDVFDAVAIAERTEFFSGSNFAAVKKAMCESAIDEWLKYARWTRRDGKWHGFFREERKSCCPDSNDICESCGSIYMTENDIPPGTMAQPIPIARHIFDALRNIKPESNAELVAKYETWT